MKTANASKFRSSVCLVQIPEVNLRILTSLRRPPKTVTKVNAFAAHMDRTTSGKRISEGKMLLIRFKRQRKTPELIQTMIVQQSPMIRRMVALTQKSIDK